MRAQRGFTLIEVAIAASISLAVILTLFSAVHQA
ncbi:MAG: prepilin-type N-terminal cleavage/methylation domain-containing protein, partial [Bdellovibrionota bacterium]